MASILVAYDELMENNLQRIQILEKMVRDTYREWLPNSRVPVEGPSADTERWSKVGFGEIAAIPYCDPPAR
jgi:type I restriction enzyme S subunit